MPEKLDSKHQAVQKLVSQKREELEALQQKEKELARARELEKNPEFKKLLKQEIDLRKLHHTAASALAKNRLSIMVHERKLAVRHANVVKYEKEAAGHRAALDRVQQQIDALKQKVFRE